MQSGKVWQWVAGVVVSLFIAVLSFGISEKLHQLQTISTVLNQLVIDFNARVTFWEDQRTFNKELLSSIKELNDKINELNLRLVGLTVGK